MEIPVLDSPARTTHKPLQTNKNNSLKALDYTEGAADTLWSTKSEDGGIKKHKKHFTCLTPSTSSKAAWHQENPLARIAREKGNRRNLAIFITTRDICSLRYQGPTHSADTGHSWCSCPESLSLNFLPRAGALDCAEISSLVPKSLLHPTSQDWVATAPYHLWDQSGRTIPYLPWLLGQHFDPLSLVLHCHCCVPWHLEHKLWLWPHCWCSVLYFLRPEWWLWPAITIAALPLHPVL